LPRDPVVQTRTIHLRAGYLVSLGFFIAAPALAQPATSPGETARPPQWTVAAGVESLWWRDVARTGPPVLASPISWEGQGPAVHASYDRGRRARLHHVEGAYSSAGGFELRSPVRTTNAPGNDSAWRAGGKYEYRRYPWRDLWMTGFDAGIGVEGSGEHLSFNRHFEPAFELRTGLTNLGTAIVLAARLERSPRWSAAAVWGNGLTLGRSTARYRGESDTSVSSWGGGWYTNLELRGELRVAPRARIYAAWLHSGEGRAANHDTFAFGRSRFTVGVTSVR
jgi:hypothetical protein